MPKLEPYNRKLNYSYALGVFPSLMLMEAHPEKIQRLLLHPDGLKNEGVIKLRDMCARLHVREEMADRVLRRVAVPIRLMQSSIGCAHVTAARTRPCLIGGERAKYTEED